jgi:hypothetical protein
MPLYIYSDIRNNMRRGMANAHNAPAGLQLNCAAEILFKVDGSLKQAIDVIEARSAVARLTYDNCDARFLESNM